MSQGIFSADSYFVGHCNPSLCYDSDQAVQTSFLITLLCITSPELYLHLTLILGACLTPRTARTKDKHAETETKEDVPMESRALKGFSYYLMLVTHFLVVNM